MTRLPPPERRVLTHDTRLESGDGRDAQGFPVRLCSQAGPPPGMHVFTNANAPEGDDQ